MIATLLLSFDIDIFTIYIPAQCPVSGEGAGAALLASHLAEPTVFS